MNASKPTGHPMAMSTVALILLLLMCSVIACGCEAASEQQDEALPQQSVMHVRLENNDLLSYDRSLTDLLGAGIDKQAVSILVEKSQYRLTVLYYGNAVKQYPIVLGGNPVDDKLMQGDGCTPEGFFVIQDLYPHQSFSKFLYIDYPNEDSWSKHEQAKREGRIPQDASIGGEIGIHGSADDSQVLRMENWTGGCIALTNYDIDEIYQVCSTGTVVEIRH